MHCFAELHVPADFDVDVMVKTSFLVMDMVMTDPGAAKNGLLWVCWMQNTGWRNFDVSYQRKIVEVFEVFGATAMNVLGDTSSAAPGGYGWHSPSAGPSLARRS